MLEIESNICRLKLEEDVCAREPRASPDIIQRKAENLSFHLPDENPNASLDCGPVHASEFSEKLKVICSHQDTEEQGGFCRSPCSPATFDNGSNNEEIPLWSNCALHPVLENPSVDIQKCHSHNSDSCTNEMPAEGSAVKATKQNKVQYNALIKKARDLELSGDLMEALKLYENAQEIFDANDKLGKKISKLRTQVTVRRQSVLQQIDMEMHDERPVQDGWEFDSKNKIYILDLHRDFFLTDSAYETLLPYQRDGVAWLCGLHIRAEGGILGDDMGLGKTCQTITFMNAAIQCGMIKRALVVAPVSVLNVWSKEFEKFGQQVVSRVMSFYGSNVRERNRNLEYVCANGGVCLTSYGLCANNAERLSSTKWDYL